MEIYESILALFGGLGVFMIAMNMMSQSLQKMAGSGMKKLIAKLTGNRFLGVGIGAIVTGIIQSSSATTVMIIGFVNSESMTLQQATSVIMGSNIGTTVTGLLASLQSLNISLYLSLFTFIGVMLMFFKKESIKNIGGIFSGLGMIFVGLNLMSESCQTAEIKEAFSNLLQKLSFPLILILLGIILTAVMQSSSAMTGIVIVLVQNGAIEVGDALFIILGSNIGTCVTAMISTIGANINAKRTGMIHLMFNVFGVLIFTIIVWSLQKYIVKLITLIASRPAMQIAWFHLLFNVITTLILLPFINILVKLSCIIMKDNQQKVSGSENKKMPKALSFINKRFLLAPQIGVMQTKKEIKNMALLAKDNFEKGLIELYTQDGLYCDEIFQREELIDYLNIETTKFLVKIAPRIDEKGADEVATFFHILNDIERIGDHAKNFLDDSNQMKTKEIKFSEKALNDLKDANSVVSKMFTIAIKSFDLINDKELNELDDLNVKLGQLQIEGSHNHFDRLTHGECSLEAGSYFTSVYAHFNSIASHLINIGHSFLKGNKNNKSLDGKEYLLVLNDNEKPKMDYLDTKNSEQNVTL